MTKVYHLTSFDVRETQPFHPTFDLQILPRLAPSKVDDLPTGEYDSDLVCISRELDFLDFEPTGIRAEKTSDRQGTERGVSEKRLQKDR